MSAGWRTLLLRIGDRCPEYGGSADHKEHIETCYGVLSREYEHSRDAIFEQFLLECAEQLPHKIPFFGVLIGLLNLENEDFVKDIVDTTQAKLQDALYNENRDRIRILLRFLSGLMCSKVVVPNSIIETFETLLSSAATILDEETGNPSWQPRADFYVYCILASLPWGGPELFEQVPDEFERVLVGIQSYLSIRRHFDDIAFSVFETDEGHSPNKKFKHCPCRISWKIYGSAFKFFPAVDGKLKVSMQPVDRFVVEECILDVLLFFNGWSNFQFIWPWQEWSYVKDLPKWAPQRVFVQEVLEREIRLSYFEKIKQSIEDAAELEELLPPKAGPNFKFVGNESSETTDGHKLSKELVGMIRGKKTVRDIILWVEEHMIPTNGAEFALDVVSQTLLDIGSKSFTHLITVLERYGQIISKLCPNEEMQLLLMDEVSAYWKNSTQMTAISIDRMMGYRMISNLAIVKWVFSPANVEQFHVSDRPWEILRNSVSKTYNRISDLRKEIQSLKKGLQVAKEVSAKAIKELEEAKSVLEIVEGQPTPAERPGRLRRLQVYADKAKHEEVTTEESLEAKGALLSRALEESKTLLKLLFKRFVDVLTERLPPVSADGEIPNLRAGDQNVNSEARDLEKATMEIDSENGADKNSEPNGPNTKNSYNVGELEQWCLCTLGYLKSFSRQYATEIWSHIAMLDDEVFVGDIHPLIRKAAFSGLCRFTNEGPQL
nr:unnamed protein product [Digitaria exilis]